jgi:FkbM family methyltransferase
MSMNQDLQAVLFEPDPDNAWLLEKTISTAQLKNARLIRSAVSNRKGTAAFAVDKASSATGSLIIDQTFNERLFGHKPRCITVETTTLDEVWKVEGLPAPDIVKIDVEMAEHLVFEGAMAMIREAQPVIIFECCSSNKQALQQLLSETGYIILGADYPDEPIESAYNLLALPARCESSVDGLLDLWRKEYAACETD